MHGFRILLTLVFASIPLGLPGAWAQDDSPAAVTVPDAALRTVLEDSLGLSAGDPIVAAELAELTDLEARDAGILDLTGLEHATGLTRLHLGPEAAGFPWDNSNDISDLSPLSGLTGLTRLNLSGNSVADVTPLSRLTGLSYLNLQGNLISDVSALASLTGLADLYLAFNALTDATSLSGLSGLTVHGLPRPKRYPKLDSTLDRLAEAHEAARTAKGSTIRSRGDPVPSRSIPVRIVTDTRTSADAVTRFLETRGVTSDTLGVGGSGTSGVLWAHVPVSLLARLSEQEGVLGVSEEVPSMPDNTGSHSQSSVTPALPHGVQAWRSAGIRGQGVVVGVIDGDFKDFTTNSKTSGKTVVARCYPSTTAAPTESVSDCEDDNAHGTWVTETLLDIAPDVSLYISNAPYRTHLRETVTAWTGLTEQDVQVINHSRRWLWDGPGDGTSPRAESPLKTVDAAVDGGILWVNSAGNQGQHTWYSGSDPLTFDANGWLVLDSDTGNACMRTTLMGDRVHRFQLRWEDSWGDADDPASSGASRNLNLRLYRQVGDHMVTARESENPQGGAHLDKPLESLRYDRAEQGIDPENDEGTYCFGVQRVLGDGDVTWVAPTWVQVQAYSARTNYPRSPDATPSGSIGNPAESANPGMLAVGGADLSDPPMIRAYSARGPTPDGRMEPKPDLVGVIDQRRGTSFSSPRVAGLAALVIRELGDIYTTPAEVAQYLKDNAQDQGDLGPDNTWGYGLARLPSVPDAPPSGTASANLGEVLVDWEPVPVTSETPEVEGYRLEVRQTPRTGTPDWSAYTLLSTLIGNVTEYTHTADESFRYQYRVRARPAGVWLEHFPARGVLAADARGQVTLSSATVDLSSAAPRIGTVLGATLVDADIPVTNAAWHWESSPDGETWEPITRENGDPATGPSYTVPISDRGLRLRAKVEYRDALSVDDTDFRLAVSAGTQPVFVWSGSITGTESWSGNVYVGGDVTIGGNLTIAAGAAVHFLAPAGSGGDGYSELIAANLGTLHIGGGVTFRSAGTATEHGLQVQAGGTATLDGLKIESGTHYLYADPSGSLTLRGDLLVGDFQRVRRQATLRLHRKSSPDDAVTVRIQNNVDRHDVAGWKPDDVVFESHPDLVEIVVGPEASMYGSSDVFRPVSPTETAAWYGIRVLRANRYLRGTVLLTGATLSHGQRCLHGEGGNVRLGTNTQLLHCGALTLPSTILVEENEREVGTYGPREELPAGARYAWAWSTEDVDGDEDDEFFTVTGSGRNVVLEFEDAPDYESSADDATYVVTIKGEQSSSSGGFATATQRLTVTVTNVNEDGTVTLSPDPGSDLPWPRVGGRLAATLRDPDGPVSGLDWQWHRQPRAGGAWDRIDEADEADEAAYTPGSGDLDHRLRALVTYTGVHGPGQTALDSTGFTIDVPDTVANLQAAAGDRQVRLTWAAAAARGAPIEFYESRYTPPGGEPSAWTKAPPEDHTARATTVADLTNGLLYTFEVRAHNAAGDGLVRSRPGTPRACAATVEGPDSVHVRERAPADSVIATFTADCHGAAVTASRWEISGADYQTRRDTLQIDDTSGQVSFKHRAPDYENPTDHDRDHDHEVQVRARVGGLWSPPRALVVTIDNIDDPGTVTITPSEPRVNRTVTAQLVDEDGPTHNTDKTWRWSHVTEDGARGSRHVPPVLLSADDPEYPPGPSDAGQRLSVTVTYDDAHGPGKTATGQSALPVRGVAPGPPKDLAATPGDRQVRLTWAAADDSGSAIDRYEYWSGSGDTTEVAGGGGARDTTVTGLINGTGYTFHIRAHNAEGYGPGAHATATVNLLDATLKVVGPDRVEVEERDGVSVATYRATDPSDVPVAPVTWSRTGSDASRFQVTDNNALEFVSVPNYERPLDDGGDNVYDVNLQAFYGEYHSAPFPVAVTVTNEDEPGVVSVSTPQPKVGLHLTATLESDPDGGVTNVTSGWHALDGSTLTSRQPPGASRGLADTYPYTVEERDRGLRLVATFYYDDAQGPNKTARDTTDAVQANVPGAPGDLRARAGDRQVSLRWTAADSNGAWITAYQHRWRLSIPPAWSSWQSAGAGFSYTVEGLDNGRTHTFEVRARNRVGEGPASNPASATPNTPVPCVLSLEGSKSSPVAYDENATGAVASYTVTRSSACDPAATLTWSPAEDRYFRLVGSGSSRALHFKTRPDFETRSSYQVTVGVTDGSASASRPVTVAITNVDEPGRLRLSTTEPRVGTAVTVRSLTDPDRIVAGTPTWKWRRGSSGTVISTANAYTPGSADVGHTLRLTASYTDGHGPDKRATATTGPVPPPPCSLSLEGPTAVDYDENGSGSVATYEATASHCDELDWSLTGDDDTAFRLEAGSSELSQTLHFHRSPNYEAKRSYEVTVGVRAGSVSKSRTVEVAIGNVDEPGTVTLSSGGPYVGDHVTATLTDPDQGIREETWSWRSVGAGTRSVESYPYTVPVSDFGKILKASVGYTDNHGPDKSASRSSSESVRAHSPDAPPNFEAARGDGQVVLTWAAADGNGAPILGYGYRYRSDTGSWPDHYTSISGRTQTIASLTNGTLYHFQVQARNIGGASSSSSDSATPAGRPGTPSGFSHTRPSGNSVRVQWDAVDNNGAVVTAYHWSRRVGSSWTNETDNGTSTNFTDTGTHFARDYTYRVRAENSVGPGSYGTYTAEADELKSAAREAAAKTLATLAGPTELAVLSAPNPFNPSTTLYFHLPEDVPVSLIIYNVAGQPVAVLIRDEDLQAGIHARQWSGLDDHGRPVGSGLYLYRLIAGTEFRVGKLTLIR